MRHMTCLPLCYAQVLWLWRGMVGDDHVVNGHVDNMACFSAPGTILMR